MKRDLFSFFPLSLPANGFTPFPSLPIFFGVATMEASILCARRYEGLFPFLLFIRKLRVRTYVQLSQISFPKSTEKLGHEKTLNKVGKFNKSNVFKKEIIM